MVLAYWRHRECRMIKWWEQFSCQSTQLKRKGLNTVISGCIESLKPFQRECRTLRRQNHFWSSSKVQIVQNRPKMVIRTASMFQSHSVLSLTGKDFVSPTIVTLSNWNYSITAMLYADLKLFINLQDGRQWMVFNCACFLSPVTTFIKYSANPSTMSQMKFRKRRDSWYFLRRVVYGTYALLFSTLPSCFKLKTLIDRSYYATGNLWFEGPSLSYIHTISLVSQTELFINILQLHCTNSLNSLAVLQSILIPSVLHHTWTVKKIKNISLSVVRAIVLLNL